MTSVRLLRRAEVQAIVGLGKTRIDDLERQGKFPKRKRLPGGRVVAWRSDEVEQWIENLSPAEDVPPDVDVSTHATADTRRKGARIRNERARVRREREAQQKPA